MDAPQDPGLVDVPMQPIPRAPRRTRELPACAAFCPYADRLRNAQRDADHNRTSEPLGVTTSDDNGQW